MKRVLDDIQTGKFTRDWMLENKVNQTSSRRPGRSSPSIRSRRSASAARDDAWIKKGALVDKARN
jgi:ketol-acid reductoisomerase